jgi:hypothetical protein
MFHVEHCEFRAENCVRGVRDVSRGTFRKVWFPLASQLAAVGFYLREFALGHSNAIPV